MTTTTTTTLENLFPDIGPKCLRPGIRRHWAPAVENVEFDGAKCVWHVMVTSDASPVVGELLRWVSDDREVGYEARINGVEDTDGVSDVAAFDVYSLGALAFVANSLRYEWENILRTDWRGSDLKEAHWTYNFVARWPNERFPGDLEVTR
jgi:hypothetical protein